MDSACIADFSTHAEENEEVGAIVASVPEEIENIEDGTKVASETENEQQTPEPTSDSLRVTLRRLDKNFQTIEDLFQHEETARRVLGDEVRVPIGSRIWTDIVDVADAAYASRAISGTELMQTIVTNFPFHSTGSPKLDRMIGGGIPSGQVSEIFGPPGCGKTQLCHAFAASAARREREVIYVDTSNSFSPQRILDFCGMKKDDPRASNILSRVAHLAIFDVMELIQKLEKIRGANNCGKLLLVDCVAAVLSPILDGPRKRNGCGNLLISETGLLLKILATEQNMTVVVSSWLGQRTLQIQGRQFVKGISTHPCRCVCTIRICLASLSIADVVQKMVNNTVGNWKFQSKGKKIIHQRGLKPALGKSWASVASLRMMLEYNFESSAHTITLLKSNRMAITGRALNISNLMGSPSQHR